MATRDEARTWVDGYVKAWTSNDEADIRALFTEDAEYRYHPWEEPVRGQDAIVASWLDSKDEPDDWSFTWDVLAVDDGTVVVQGRTPYLNGSSYLNLWVIRLTEDGRASRFTEWYLEEPTDPPTVS